MGSVKQCKVVQRPLFQDVEDDVKKLVPEGVGRVPYKEN
jgi:hypothetical protein